ncbi:hypothetical protein A2721_02785 [Candidatus Gottesmanbacteria bacterium RIFCSPHIGHO2_01_FULL_47_48]|uniref:Glycoside hydrolase family 57 N-terminal domain-containing protein n=1 Tax=Candidatus Gottesmanbacteria bacterium RIFCSPHIGHO2_01_FULL_47_48 TaxID=1798381 RepID=A0A1F6A414_9BACT|nr:MAG: hypothetical protein A2721_02785 [Candidatus Gottesmanbacteria bacterium RIFCSPHIGHO2_01_FULL_47_48]
MPSWALILHFYQPPSQSLTLTELILRSSYLPFLDLLLTHPEIQMTLNISASLLLQLEQIKDHDFFEKIKALGNRGQIEFLNSAIFHPILPLTPLPVITRQIKENAEIVEKFCHSKPVPGFFPPELAVDEKVLRLISKQMDFTIIDESSLNPNFDLKEIPKSSIFKFQISNFKFLVSSRSLTELIRGYPTVLHADKLITFINSQISVPKERGANLKSPLVSVSDAEVFGHHYSERTNLLRGLFESGGFRFIKATTALENLKSQVSSLKSSLVASSWQTAREDIKAGVPFIFWNNPHNPLQKKYHRLAQMAYKFLKKCSQEESSSHTIHSAEHYFDQGISSCHTYWLSNSPWWHPDLAELGARNLVKTIRTLPVAPSQKLAAERFYHRFMLEVWNRHWSGEVENQYRLYDSTRVQFLNSLPKLE